MNTHPQMVALRAQVDEMLDLLAAAEARYCLGESATFEPGEVYAGWPDVVRLDTIAELRAAGVPDRTSRPLIGLVVQALVESSCDPLRTRIAAREREVTVTGATGERTTVARARRPADSRPGAASDRQLRQVYDAEIAPLWLETHDARLAVIRAAGYPDLAEYAARVQGHDLERLEREANAFLGSTRSRYEALRRPVFGDDLGTVAGLIGAVRAEFADPVNLTTCLPLLRLFVAGLGLDLEPRIRLDLDARPGKVTGAYCIPVKVPKDIVVAVSAVGGVGDCRPLFHETGHALHFAHTDGELPVDGRRMGDEGLVEGWGVVTENLFLHQGWLARSFPRRTAVALGRDTARRLLIVARAQCVRLLFAVDAGRRPAGPVELRYRYDQLMAEHLGARSGPVEYLDVLCGGLACATRLRSWEFGTAVADLLNHDVGQDWSSDPRAGSWLRDPRSAGGGSQDVADLADLRDGVQVCG